MAPTHSVGESFEPFGSCGACCPLRDRRDLTPMLTLCPRATLVWPKVAVPPLVNSYVSAESGASRRPRKAVASWTPPLHRRDDLQGLDQRVAEAGAVPEELVIAIERAHRARDVIGDDISRGICGDGLVGVSDPDVQLRLAPPCDSVVVELNWLPRQDVDCIDLNIADPVDEILVAAGSGSRMTRSR